MSITIDQNILEKHGITFSEFLVLLTGYYDLKYDKNLDALVERGLAEKNLYSKVPPVLSNNSRKLVHQILMESSGKMNGSVDKYFHIARRLQELYPEGNKPGTTYPWRGDTQDIATRLMTLTVKYDFHFTEEEAVAAVQEYIDSFDEDTKMHLLQNFILRTEREEDDNEITSLFMSTIENGRYND